ncbi:hypothetical protein HYS72_03565 [Candidatus Pacearchaeota archaeon]|nr:hypothetical protein [Candidatus Pacearchaeota archaeon]
MDKDTIEGFEHKREVILGKNKFYNPSKESDLEELIERIMISTKNFPDGTHAFTEDGKLIRYSAE